MRRPKPPIAPKIAAARGLLQMGVGATVGVAAVAEAVHLAVLSVTPLSPTRALTRGIYAGVRGLAQVAGHVGEQVLRAAEHGAGVSEPGGGAAVAMPAGFRSALNGVAGDRLARMGNPLALPMSLESHARLSRRSATADRRRGRVLFIHGLCMHDGHWQDAEGPEVCFGERLKASLDLEPVYLRYNSGRSIAENGQSLAALLARRFAGRRRWEGPLHVVAHSLGGLLIRSALAAGRDADHAWVANVGHVVFLGTPHEGAPLERVGKQVEVALAASRFSAPWAAVGRLRSVAIHQLGHAEVAPLGRGLPHVRFHALAGRVGRLPAVLGEVWGDGLVPVTSALASRLPADALPIHSRRVFTGIGHFGLIRHSEVAAHVGEVLASRTIAE